MFSANENLQLRQHKRRIVAAVEATIPEDVLEYGTNVMVMQVACQDPGCVPIETAIIIVFPKMDDDEKELLPGLPQSAGGSYKTKILKPMAEVVTPDDVLDALPPSFTGGRKTVARMARSLRDVVLAQIQQLAGNGDSDDTALLRKELAEYLKESLEEYVQHGCVPPPLDGEYEEQEQQQQQEEDKQEPQGTNHRNNNRIPATGNYVMRRPAEDEDDDDEDNNDDNKNNDGATNGNTNTPAAVSATSRDGGSTEKPVSTLPKQGQPQPQQHASTDSSSSRPTPPFDSVSRQRQQAAAARNLRWSNLARTAGPFVLQQPHAPGIRRMGCPCCDPDNPSTAVDQMMQL